LTKPNFGAIGLTALAGSSYSGSSDSGTSESGASSSDSSSGSDGDLEIEVVDDGGSSSSGGGGSGTGGGYSYSTGGSYSYSYSYSDSGFYAWGYTYEYSSLGTGPVAGALGDGKLRWDSEKIKLGGGELNFPESSPPEIEAPDLSILSIEGFSKLGEKRWDALSQAEAFWDTVDAVEDAFAWAGDQVRELFDNAAKWIEDAGIWAAETYGWDGFAIAGSFLAGFTSAAGDVLGSMVDIPGTIHGVVDAISNLTTSDLLDGLQGALDVVGFIPVVGEIADGINGVVSLARGDYVGAALSFVSMVPVVGDAIGKGGKAARFVADKADDVMAIGRLIKCKVTGTGCFVAGTKVWLSASVNQPDHFSERYSPQYAQSSFATLLEMRRTITKQAIESVAVGSRVSGENPRPWEHDGEFPEPTSSTWKLAKFSLQKEAGNWVDVEMIRPNQYWESKQATPGSLIFMEFPELEASGMAQVRSMEPCPPIAEGVGNVVTARIVTRQVSELVEIEFGNESLTGTPQHPVWSIERQDWIDLGEIEVGEHLSTEDGPVEVQSKRLLSTAESVYNLEVHGHHIYQVGELGVLVHNPGFKYKTRPKPAAKRGPKTSDTAPHNAKIIEEREKIIKAGGKIIGGGRLIVKGKRLAEAIIEVAKGKFRRPDILYTDKNGVMRAVNVGLKNAKGKPVRREREALRDLNRKVPTTFVPYN